MVKLRCPEFPFGFPSYAEGVGHARQLLKDMTDDPEYQRTVLSQWARHRAFRAQQRSILIQRRLHGER